MEIPLVRAAIAMRGESTISIIGENCDLMAECEFLALYIFTKNYFCDENTKNIQELEHDLLLYFECMHTDILQQIRIESGISNALSERIASAVKTYKSICQD